MDCVGLAQAESCDLTRGLVDLVGDLVGALSPQPLVGPLCQNKITLGVALIVAFLERLNEVRERGVLPCVPLEVDLDPIAEGVPAHQENQLFQQTGTLSIGDPIDK